MQVCLGAEHGVLLTDSGMAFTWGDNRYGQLGRTPQEKEENEVPYVVKSLIRKEIAQVAAGKHHCLALATDSSVWGWGRNKVGQLATGDYRDRCFPVQVKFDTGEPLLKVQAIGAGSLSSVAACSNSNIYQWGEISAEFGNAKNRPFCVMNEAAFREKMRKDAPVSISSTDCRIQTDRDGSISKTADVRDTMETIRNIQQSIAQSRMQLTDIQDRQEAEVERVKKLMGSSDGNDLNDLADTSAQLERDVASWEQEIQLYSKNMKSCQQQQEHNRKQLHALEQQGVQLGESADQTVLHLVDIKGVEARKLQEKLTDIREFQEANQNTRMTLLDQRAEIDKEKQILGSKLNLAKSEKDKMEKRLKMVKELSADAKNMAGASSKILQLVNSKLMIIKEYYDTRRLNQPKDFVSVMQDIEADDKFLDTSLTEMGELHNIEHDEPHRADRLQDMMKDIIELRRENSDLTTDKWSKDRYDLCLFFDGCKKPTEPHEEISKS